MTAREILVGGEWRSSDHTGTFQARNPSTGEPLSEIYPVSSWRDCDAALREALDAAEALREVSGDRLGSFLETYADRIGDRAGELVEIAHTETALPRTPRLADGELPRTIRQLRQAAAAAREGSWSLPTIDTEAGVRSRYAALGTVCIFGPNNFPFAFGSVSGGDFAAAIASGNVVIGKAHPSHPATTRIFAQEALEAVRECGLPGATVQLLFRLDHEDGNRLVGDPRTGATAYTGSRPAGLELKAAADARGKPIYLELSSVNPVVVLPGALEERLEAIAEAFTKSCLTGTGQFCTNPGLVLLIAGPRVEEFVAAVARRFDSVVGGTLLSEGVEQNLAAGIEGLRSAGADLVTGDEGADGPGYRRSNTLLRVGGSRFLENPEALQAEAFGNESLFVVADDIAQLCRILEALEGNLTGCVYSDTEGSDDADYERIEPRLRRRVGRLINDKMPTGVALSPAMNHGGPYPATGHPGFTAVGIPASMRRFGMLECYDNVRPHRLPPILQDRNPTGKTWRLVDGTWTQEDVG
jgi:alpha-ketoglutaric semialdehyde dehydrogenase